MRRICLPLAVLVGGAMWASAALADASAEAGARAARGTTVELASTRVGKILVTGSGFTLYAFTRDSRRHESCQTKRGCTTTWPPLLTAHAPIAGRGVRAGLLGRIRLRDGDEQVTYAGHPLYRFSLDSHRAETDYVGDGDYGGHWNALSAAGRVVR